MNNLLVMALLLLTLSGCGGNKGGESDVAKITTIGQGPQKIWVVNESDYPAENVSAYVEAQNIQLTRDFAPKWGIQASLEVGQPPKPEALQLRFLRDFTQFTTVRNANTFHGLHYGNVAYVNYLVCGPEGSTSSAASHECLEMLGNPNNNQVGYEVCDPVAPYAYEILGVQVADFVFPNYFQQGSAGPWDQLGHITRQGVPAPGGVNWQPDIDWNPSRATIRVTR